MSPSDLAVVIVIFIVLVMGKVGGKHLLCFLLLSVALCWAEDSRKDVRKADNDTGEVTRSFVSSGEKRVHTAARM